MSDNDEMITSCRRYLWSLEDRVAKMRPTMWCGHRWRRYASRDTILSVFFFDANFLVSKNDDESSPTEQIDRLRAAREVFRGGSAGRRTVNSLRRVIVEYRPFVVRRLKTCKSCPDVQSETSRGDEDAAEWLNMIKSMIDSWVRKMNDEVIIRVLET